MIIDLKKLSQLLINFIKSNCLLHQNQIIFYFISIRENINNFIYTIKRFYLSIIDHNYPYKKCSIDNACYKYCGVLWIIKFRRVSTPSEILSKSQILMHSLYIEKKSCGTKPKKDSVHATKLLKGLLVCNEIETLF